MMENKTLNTLISEVDDFTGEFECNISALDIICYSVERPENVTVQYLEALHAVTRQLKGLNEKLCDCVCRAICASNVAACEG